MTLFKYALWGSQKPGGQGMVIRGAQDPTTKREMRTVERALLIQVYAGLFPSSFASIKQDHQLWFVELGLERGCAQRELPARDANGRLQPMSARFWLFDRVI